MKTLRLWSETVNPTRLYTRKQLDDDDGQMDNDDNDDGGGNADDDDGNQ